MTNDEDARASARSWSTAELTRRLEARVATMDAIHQEVGLLSLRLAAARARELLPRVSRIELGWCDQQPYVHTSHLVVTGCGWDRLGAELAISDDLQHRLTDQLWDAVCNLEEATQAYWTRWMQDPDGRGEAFRLDIDAALHIDPDDLHSAWNHAGDHAGAQVPSTGLSWRDQQSPAPGRSRLGGAE